MPRSEASTLRHDHAAFALRLGAALDTDATANRVWSPYSVATALGLLATGARGTTHQELTELLGSDLTALLADLDRSVQADGEDTAPEIASRTALWTRTDTPVERAFEAELHQRPEAALAHADFVNNAEQARRDINADVAKVTHGMIEDLLAPGTVHSQTRALLVNALWARVTWINPFEIQATTSGQFHATTGPSSVPMMRYAGRLRYGETSSWRMVTLRGTHNLALDVLLPTQPQAPDSTPPLPTAAELTQLNHNAAQAEVRLQLPRFSLTYDSELTTALHRCGVRTVFTSDADLSGISPLPLTVDAVQHKARLDVNEYGAEGAAATAVVMTVAAVSPRRPVTFTADRPFHVLLRRRGALLFLGTIGAA